MCVFHSYVLYLFLNKYNISQFLSSFEGIHPHEFLSDELHVQYKLHALDVIMILPRSNNTCGGVSL